MACSSLRRRRKKDLPDASSKSTTYFSIGHFTQICGVQQIPSDFLTHSNHMGVCSLLSRLIKRNCFMGIQLSKAMKFSPQTLLHVYDAPSGKIKFRAIQPSFIKRNNAVLVHALIYERVVSFVSGYDCKNFGMSQLHNASQTINLLPPKVRWVCKWSISAINC